MLLLLKFIVKTLVLKKNLFESHLIVFFLVFLLKFNINEIKKVQRWNCEILTNILNK